MSALASAQRKKAIEFQTQATAALQKKSWFASGRERNQEDAAELYQQAANAYKVGGFGHEAGVAYTEAATLYRDALKNPVEASKCFSSAGSCFKSHSATDAVKAYKNAVDLLIDAGRLTQAAKLCKECAELYEAEEVEIGEKSHIVLAIEAYEQAAELFGMEQSKGQASGCKAKVAELCSAALQPPDLIRSAAIYEELGRNCLESNLLKFNAKGHFLQCILCHLANNDAVGAEEALSKFERIDYTFNESREGKFVRKLVECVEGLDSELFETTCFEYDRISKLDPWKTSMLLKVKRSIQGDDAGEGDDDDVDLTVFKSQANYSMVPQNVPLRNAPKPHTSTSFSLPNWISGFGRGSAIFHDNVFSSHSCDRTSKMIFRFSSVSYGGKKFGSKRCVGFSRSVKSQIPDL